MPILNPQQAFNLLKYSGNEKSIVTFLKLLLPIASENANKNQKMVLNHQKFIEFILGNIKNFQEHLNFTSENIKNFLNLDKNDAYHIIYDILQSDKTKEKESEKNIENYVFDKIFLSILSSTFLQSIQNVNIDFPDETPFFFVPFVTNKINCFISSKSYAILTYTLTNNKSISDDDIFLINLASYILVASGHLIVFCFYQKYDFRLFNYIRFLNFNLFAESHIFTQIHYRGYDDDFNYDLSFLKKSFSDIGYVYIYANAYSNNYKIIKEFEKYKNTFVKFFYFSKKLREIFKFKNDSITKASGFKPLRIDLSGFLKNSLPINLCNIPLFKDVSRINDVTPEKLSGIGIGEIDPSDFHFCNCKRVYISINGDDDYYVEFDDLHLMNLELYIAEPMYLGNEKLDIYTVEKVKDHYKEDTRYFDKQKAKNADIDANVYEKMLMSFHYLHKYTKDKNGKNIHPYTSQIYAVYQAINKFIYSKQKGVILQVQTGEGKSFIVQALAEHLSRQDNIVHIATSNIILAARDFEKAYDYYRKTEKKYKNRTQKHFRPSILIHSDECQYIQKFLDENKEIDEMEKKLFYTNKENYNNKTDMNISVCLNDKSIKSNIVYSTFLNFEAFYLDQYEKNPRYLQEYMNKCYLIIDEADTILIDELTNGTILSKPMKSNAKDVLTFIYDNYTSGNKNEDSVLKLVHDKYPECHKMTKDDVLKIFSDIVKVCDKDFTRGSKYCIYTEKNKDPKIHNPKIICPFDAEHKGIVEVNKEFSGFIHQLIGIKEKKDHPEENEKLEIQPLSMNYLFISHPIYVNKYKGVCGVTGTVGTGQEKKLLSKYYDLSTEEVPRHQMNLRYDLPMIMCRTMQERNERICLEIKKLHINEYPVLVVFNNNTEIEIIKQMLIDDYDIKDEIAIFNGQSNENDESIKQKLEEQSGKPGAITLGTNFCGRGVSIEYVKKPLFVIVSYFNEDKRSINQVLGRAGRNGHPGISRIICTKEMFYNGSAKPSEKIMKCILNEFEVKNDAQVLLINKIKKLHSWIFDESQCTERMSKSDAYKLRQCQINVNRITSYHCIFPICMTYEQFFDIQSQRIFSIKNCPECKYTWNLFRNYIRELIYESWSIFIDSVDNNYKKMVNEDFKFETKDYSKINEESLYLEFFKDQYTKYEKLLFKYIPENSCYNIIDTFMKIHDIVVDNYQNLILSNIPDSMRKMSLIKGKKDSYTSFRFGFFPMNLAENSGAKLTPLSKPDQKKSEKGLLYIIDPELQYIKSNGDKFSITKILDDIFFNFQEIVDKNLQGLFGIRFFLRRTLGGCEFGICVVPPYESDDNLLNCLIDRNPLIMLTICTKSTFFWIMGTLIIVLFFVVTISVMIFTKFLSVKELGSKVLEFLKKGIKNILIGKDDDGGDEDSEGLIGKGVNIVFDKIVKKLTKMIKANIEKNDLGLSVLFETIINLFVPMDTDGIDEKLTEKVFTRFKINDKAMNYIKGLSIFGKLIKIGILFVILIATFVLNFKHKIRLNYEKFTKDTSSSYERESKNYKIRDTRNSDAFYDTEKKINRELDIKDLD